MGMHYLQKYILDKLRFEQPLNYSAMLPDNIESSLFQYHLKALVKDGLVQKQDDGAYALTHAGQAALEYMSVGRTTQVRMPKVITYTLLTHQGKLLLLRKQKEPYRNLLEPVGGKVHFGEEPQAAAQREVTEKLGLQLAERPMLRGVADIIINKDGEPLTHMVVYMHTCELPAIPANLPDYTVWLTHSELKSRNDLVASTLPLIDAALSGQELFVSFLRLDA